MFHFFELERMWWSPRNRKISKNVLQQRTLIQRKELVSGYFDFIRLFFRGTGYVLVKVQFLFVAVEPSVFACFEEIESHSQKERCLAKTLTDF